MNELAVVIYSCDKNEELWPLYKKCIDKYWEKHPNIYMLTESITSPLFITITKKYDLDHWTTRIRKSLEEIKEKYVIFMSDDCFLNDYVNIEKLKNCINILDQGKYAAIQFELSWSDKDIESEYEGFKIRTDLSPYKLSLLCGMWNKKALIHILEKDSDPWSVEKYQDCKGYTFLQVTNEKVLSWFNDKYGGNGAIRYGLWQHGVEEFLEKEGLSVDFSKKGFRE